MAVQLSGELHPVDQCRACRPCESQELAPVSRGQLGRAAAALREVVLRQERRRRRHRTRPRRRLRHPPQRHPDEIAAFILFVASDQARFATGSEMVADGGFTLGPLA
ncbi:SDR family oxidoreductase [Streptomyces sp. 12257]|nr:SDR family oxidoreductase [Streptomyces sp. 12257]MDI5910151.1 SDR family oxidoreductase [Streptomyces sp. 12257]